MMFNTKSKTLKLDSIKVGYLFNFTNPDLSPKIGNVYRVVKDESISKYHLSITDELNCCVGVLPLEYSVILNKMLLSGFVILVEVKQVDNKGKAKELLVDLLVEVD